MTNSKELKKKAEKQYTDFLQYYFDNLLENFFPLVIPCNKGNANDDFEKRSAELHELHQNSKNNGKKSYKYDSEKVKTRSGLQTVITRVYFENQEDFLNFINKTKDFETLKKVSTIVLENLHTSFSKDEIKNWLLKNYEICSSLEVEEDIDSFWKNICLCANWFYQNPESNLYMRSVPLEVHSKFIESNQTVIHSLISDEKITKENSFIKQHGLASKPDFVRFRFLGNAELSQCFTPKEMLLRTDDFERLNSADFMANIKSIFIIENEMVYLTFPKLENALCIWGHGFTVGLFKRFHWLNDYELLYFGDLDEHGYDILSIFRSSFHKTKSFCMDMETFNKFKQFRVKGEILRGDIPQNLTEEEKKVFSLLKEDSSLNRLEQERISQQWIRQTLNQDFCNRFISGPSCN